MRRLTLVMVLGIPLFALGGEASEPDGGRPEDPQGPLMDDRALPMYESNAPAGTYLLGLDVSARKQGNGKLYFNSLLPIYGTADGAEPVHGKPFMGNTNPGNHSVLVAKEGYAVGAVVYHQNGTVIDGVRVVFDRVAGNRLDPSDSYASQWVGEQGKVVADSHGSLVVGVRAGVGTVLHTIEVVSDRPGDNWGGGAGAVRPTTSASYREPDVARAPFAAGRLKLPKGERVKLATALGEYATAHEVSPTTSKLIGVALAVDPENRTAVLGNADLKRGGAKSGTRPATMPAENDLVAALLEAAKACKGSTEPADVALAACLYDLTLTLRPNQEDALYESELLRHKGHAPDWEWAVGTSAAVAEAGGASTVEAKAFAKRQVAVKGLAITSDQAGQRFGRVLEIIMTVSPQPAPQGASGRVVEFAGGQVGAEMRTALDEAVRTVQFQYPRWERNRVVLSFDDKYSPKDGGSAGTAFALGLLSALEGWDLDPKFAVTGDITVDGKVRGVGGVDAKIRGAAADGCELVSVPSANAERVADYLVLTSPKSLAEIQIFESSTLADAKDLAQKVRPENLRKAIDLFAEFQSAYKAAPTQATLAGDDAKDKLRGVLELAPNHLSAKYLLLCAEGKQPKKLSVGMSMYRMALATNQFVESLNDSKKLTKGRLSESVFADARGQLRALRAVAADETVQAVQALQDFIEAIQRFNRHVASEAEVDRRFDVWRAALTKLSANPDTMAKLLREGI